MNTGVCFVCESRSFTLQQFLALNLKSDIDYDVVSLPETMGEGCDLIFHDVLDNWKSAQMDAEVREKHRRDSFVNKPKKWRMK